jgi:D-lactate dehydrogenase
MALLMCVNRKIHKAYNKTRDGNFCLNGLLGINLFEKNVGIVGNKIFLIIIIIFKEFIIKNVFYFIRFLF